jgi:fructose-1,6-bisphosphatase II
MTAQACAWEATALALAGVTEAAALAAWPFRGRNQPELADAAAAGALRSALPRLAARVYVITGEGEKDGVEHVAAGEHVGAAAAQTWLDLAVDPIDGTSRLSLGRPGALVAAALVPHGGLFDPGPSHYMDKLVCSAAAGRFVDPEQPTAELLTAVARGLGKPLDELAVFVLDKPRSLPLAAAVRASGARVLLHDAGDLEASIATALPGSEIDLVLGIGGTPEGLVAACAVRALGGHFFAKLAPQREPEALRLRAAGLLPARWIAIEELVPASHYACSVTGVTPCALVSGIEARADELVTETLLLWGPTREQARLHRVYRAVSSDR